jgi:uncharacterized phage protein (predicted DNA packaging)
MLNVVVLTMGPLLTLDQAKAHLRVGHGDEDALIELYADAAVQSCLKHCGRKIVPPGDEAVFRAAALLMLGDLYANREGVIAGQTFSVSPTIENLLYDSKVIRI